MNIVQQLKVQTGESDAMSVMFAVHPGLTSAMARYGAVCLERTAYGTCACAEQSCDRRHDGIDLRLTTFCLTVDA